MKAFATKVMAAALAVGCAGVTMVHAAPATKSGKTNFVHSEFILPSNPKEGRDPFYPDSIRPYENAAAASPRTAAITSLVLKGFSGDLSNRLVIINNHTFAAGDEGDVTTSTGRVHVRCVEIKTNSVIVEVDNQYHELSYTP
jgi:hypothetical protein